MAAIVVWIVSCLFIAVVLAYIVELDYLLLFIYFFEFEEVKYAIFINFYNFNYILSIVFWFTLESINRVLTLINNNFTQKHLFFFFLDD